MIFNWGGAFHPLLLVYEGGCFAPPPFLHPRAGGFWVLGCSDPLSVRSVAVCLLLAAPLKTSLLRHGFYFRVTVVFSFVLRTTQKKPVTLQESCLQRTANPQILRILCILRICSWYLLSILLYSCLFYNVNIDVVCVSGTVSLNPENLLRTALPLYTTVLFYQAVHSI